MEREVSIEDAISILQSLKEIVSEDKARDKRQKRQTKTRKIKKITKVKVKRTPKKNSEVTMSEFTRAIAKVFKK